MGMTAIARSLQECKFALAVFAALLVATLAINPAGLALKTIGTTLGLVSPLIVVACAVTVVFLSGRGGIDLSVGPLMGFINVVLVKVLILDAGVSSPFIVIPAALAIGLLGGAINGALAVYLRIQPIVATLASFLMLSGASSWILPSPVGPVPAWLTELSQGRSFLPLVAVAAIWTGIRCLPLYRQILQIGEDDRAAFAAGVNVQFVRFVAYLVAGLFSAIAALALTALLGSADAQIGANYTLLAIAAAALGGVSLAGGRGSLIGASLGAIDIFLIKNLITYFNVSTFVLQITYGVVLVIAVSLNSERLSDLLRSTVKRPSR